MPHARTPYAALPPASTPPHRACALPRPPTALALLAALALSAAPAADALAAEASVASPDGRLVVSVSDEAGAARWSASYDGAPLVEPSALGLAFVQAPEFGPGFAIAGVERAEADATWEQPWGEQRLVRDHHRELAVRFQRADARATAPGGAGVPPPAIATGADGHHFTVRVRVFDDGLGFRYEVPAQPGLDALHITDELTEFRIPAPRETTAWWIPGRGWNRYEYLYRETPLAEVDRAHTPMTLRLPSGVHLAIHEAALVDYAAMVIDQQRDGVLKADLTPWHDGIRVRTRAGFRTPWRTVQVSPTAAGLLASTLTLNLNEPNALGDVSWVRPGKYVGIWWGMHLGVETWGSGPTHGATTANARRYIDFAADNGFDGVLVEGWNLGWDGDWFHNGDQFDFTRAYPDFDIEALAAHARARGVRLIGHHETAGHVSRYADQREAAFALYERLGITQVKTGYVADGGQIRRVDEDGVMRREWHDGQFMVEEHLRTLRHAAEHRISLNAHEPIKDTGLRRTYPNWLSREGARGQEYNAWGTPPNPPEHVALLPYTRMLAGPMDYTPGIVNLAHGGLDAVNRVQHTLAKELSLYVVLYSPVHMAADLPEHYAAQPDAFAFIRRVPTDWEHTRPLAGEVGRYVAIARQPRGGEDWYLGALTDADARTLRLPLDFLTPGRRYVAELWRDGEGADWRTAPYAMVRETREVTSADTLELWLAASGGAAVHIRPVED